MKTFDFKINSQIGLHARPSGLLVREASNFKSKIELMLERECETKTVSAKSLFDVMGLAIKSGEVVRVIIDGEDEEIAFEKISEFFKKNFSV